jgi:hypothetical protein
LIVVKDSSEEITGWEAESMLKKEENTTISLVFGVGRSSSVAGCHSSTARSRRKWFAMS